MGITLHENAWGDPLQKRRGDLKFRKRDVIYGRTLPSPRKVIFSYGYFFSIAGVLHFIFSLL